LSLNYSEVYRLYCDAEKKIKKVEHLSAKIAIPAINQLRYSGRHLVRSLVENLDDPSAELKQAENHCKRACYDACEAGLLFCMGNFRSFQNDFRKASISAHFPEYIQACETFEDARRFVDVTPADNTREEFYQAIDKHFDAVLVYDKKLPYIREEVNKNLGKERKTAFWVVFGAMLALIGAIAAILAIPGVQDHLTKKEPSPSAQIKASPVLIPPSLNK